MLLLILVVPPSNFLFFLSLLRIDSKTMRGVQSKCDTNHSHGCRQINIYLFILGYYTYTYTYIPIPMTSNIRHRNVKSKETVFTWRSQVYQFFKIFIQIIDAQKGTIIKTPNIYKKYSQLPPCLNPSRRLITCCLISFTFYYSYYRCEIHNYIYILW